MNKEKIKEITLGAFTIIGLIAALLIIGSFIANLGSEDTSSPEKNVPTQDSIDIPVSSETLKKSYLRGCESKAGEKYCQCTWEYLDERMTNEELIEMGQKIYEGIEPPIMQDAVQECLQYYEYEGRY